MYAVEIDNAKQLLVITGIGNVTRQEVQAAAEKVEELLRDAQPGLRALADYRWVSSMDSSAAPHIAAIMDKLAAKQVASVTRVMPDPRKDIGLNILSQFHYGANIQISTFETMADALQSLAEN